MADEVNANRLRRRQRSRKKKVPVTIESLVPGRAPLGFCLSSPKPSTSLRKHATSGLATRASEVKSELTEDKSEHSSSSNSSNPDLIPDSPESHLSKCTSNPACSIINTRAILLSPRARQSRQTVSLIQHHPKHPRLFSDSLLPASRLDISGGLTVDSSRRSISAIIERQRRSASVMVTQRLSLKPQSRLMTTRAVSSTAILQGVNHDLNSVDDLASSRPIPLSALCNRASSRSKRSRSWKSIPLDVDGENPNDPVGNAIFSEVSQYKPRSRVSAMLQSNTEGWNPDYLQSNNLTVPQSYGPDERLRHRSEPVGQSWSREASAQIQENPLSYSSGYDSPYHTSFAQQNGYISESPFIRNDNYLRSEQSPWSTDQYSATNDSYLMGVVEQPAIYTQSHFSGTSLAPESTFHDYGSEPFHSYSSSSHEASTHPLHGHEHMGFHRPTHMLNYSFSGAQHEGYYRYEANQSEDSFPTFRDGLSKLPTDSKAVELSPKTQIPIASNPRLSELAHGSDTVGSKVNKNDVANPIKETKICGTKEEVAAFLNDVVQKAQMSVKQTALHDPFVETKNPLVSERQESGSRTNSKQPLQTNPDIQTKGHTHKPSLASRSDTENEAFRLLCQTASIENPTSKHATKDQDNQEEADPFDSRAGTLSTATGKILRPPPGLPKPAAHNMGIGSPPFEHHSLLDKKRFEEANRWFKQDGRGEEKLRQHVSQVAQDYAEECEKNQGTSYPVQNSVAAKQMTLLLGNVIANLQSYVTGDRAEQAKNFADFGVVKSRVCEPGHGGRRSYFDQDPLVDQWRLPSGRAFSGLSNRSDKKLFLAHLQRSPLQDEWGS